MIAYITTEYPAIAHSFILREVEALRRRGVEVATTSVHRASPDQVLSEGDRRAFETTYAVLPARWLEVAAAHLYALRHPLALLATLRLALEMRRPGLRGLLWQLFYLGEAVTVWHRWRRLGVRHVHAHFAAAPSDVALLASHLGRASGSGPGTWSLTVHGPIELWDVNWFRLAEKVRRADAVVCISYFARSQLMAFVENEHWPKLHVIHCGVVPALYANIGAPPPGRLRILCVGRLVSQKGQSLLITALSHLIKRGVEAEVELVGEGPNREQLERLVAELRLQDRVRFAGAVAEDAVTKHYEAATIFCLPSFGEGVPVVLMEAMASGRPVLTTAVAGVPELVRDGDTGVVVTPGHQEDLTDALERLLRDPDLRGRLGEAARRYVRQHYDVDASARRLKALFAGLHGELPAMSTDDLGGWPLEEDATTAATGAEVVGR